MVAFPAGALKFEPQFEERIWGGRSLERYGKRLPLCIPIGESWEISDVEGKPSRIVCGPHSGLTLRDLMERDPRSLLGSAKAEGPGERFPLLLKLIDAREMLSVQLHPSDEDLRRAGSAHAGKTEAWVILEAEPGAQIIHGLATGVTRRVLIDRLERLGGAKLPDGEERSLFRWVGVSAGDVVFIPAGTIHALGGGIVLLEVQQTSDITYRIFDWNRPASAGRALHIEQSVAVTNPLGTGRVQPALDLQPDDQRSLVQCPYFTLELLTAQPQPLLLDTRGASFHALTVIDGQGTITCGEERITLNRFETVLVAARAGAYHLHPIGSVRALKASAL